MVWKCNCLIAPYNSINYHQTRWQQSWDRRTLQCFIKCLPCLCSFVLAGFSIHWLRRIGHDSILPSTQQSSHYLKCARVPVLGDKNGSNIWGVAKLAAAAHATTKLSHSNQPTHQFSNTHVVATEKNVFPAIGCRNLREEVLKVSVKKERECARKQFHSLKTEMQKDRRHYT